ncbi:MAG: hypothetical protein ABWY48_03380 [Pseudoxanthomonas sp.]
MSTRFATHQPPETSLTREVRLAVEVLDPVTCERIRDGLTVQARGLLGKPIVNAGGMFVWTREPGREPLEVFVDPGYLPFAARTQPAPAAPGNFLSITLSPTSAYAFSSGIPGIRGRLVERRLDDPAQPVPGATVWLQWIDDSTGTETWIDAPVRATTDGNGEFAAIVRLASSQAPLADAQGYLRVRVAATRGGATRRSPERSLPPGRVADMRVAFAWDEFLP